MRILLVSQMYPGPAAPDLGTFVAQVERELVARGHEIELAVLDTRAGGKLRYLTLARRTLAAARPDVVYAHFDTVRLPFPPALVQRIGLALGAPLGRVLGYDAVYVPAQPTSTAVAASI